MAYAKVINCLLRGEEFVIHGDGEQRRSNTYIDDIVNATLLAQTKSQSGDVMNVCGDETVSLNDAICIIEKVSGKKLRRSYKAARIGDQRETSGSNKFIKESLGWKAVTTIEEGLKVQVETAIRVS